jgi:hypothetical protein
MQLQQRVGPFAEDYAPYYKRFLQNPFGPHYFNWLPSHIFSPNDIAAVQLLERPRDFFRHLNDYVPKFRKPLHNEATFAPSNIFVKQKEKLIEKAIIALRLRSAFRRLVHVWIWRKAARAPLPDTDAITMAPFRQAVIITDMLQRRAYKFEASSLIAHIESQLNYVNYGFVQSLHPRNPITNLPFSSGQFIELYKQCLVHGQMNSSFAAFAECKFNLQRYYIIYQPAIAFHYNLKIITETTNETGHEILLEFIEDMAELLVVDISILDIEAFRYGLAHFPTHPYFKKWRRIFIAKQFCNEEDTMEDKILFNSLIIRASDLFDVRSVVVNEFRRAKMQVDDEL